MHPLQLTLAVADLPSISSYPGALFLSTLGVDPTELSTYVVVLVLEYAGRCGALAADGGIEERGRCRLNMHGWL